MHTYRVLIVVAFIAFFTCHSLGQSDQALVDRYDKMYAAEKYEVALKAAEQICERYPKATGWHFKAGALHAKLGNTHKAIEHLQVCADENYTGISSFEQNSDLDSIRDRDDFKLIIGIVQKNAKERLDQFIREALNHTPQSYVPEGDEKKPLIIALHGTGMDGQSMFDALIDACKSEGAILIAPDALRPSGDGFAWTYRDESKWFVNHLIDKAIKEKNADPERVILVGFSQGANIALILGQTQPKSFIGVVPICGHYESQNAVSNDVPAPFYLMSGARDPWKGTYTKAKRDFEEAGGEVRIRVLSGKGHQIPIGKSGTREYVKAIQWALRERSGG